MTLEQVNEAIVMECEALAKRLIDKNIAYNNSLQSPLIKLSSLQNSEKILSRMEDKMNRFARAGFTGDTEDSLEDFLGYYIHYRIALKTKYPEVGV